MANHRKKQVGKRKSKGWRKKSPKCTLCTYFRWLGNSKGRKRHSYYRQQKVESLEDQTLTISLGARSVVPATRPQSSTVREQQSMPRKSKRRETRSHDFDQEVVKEINRQTQIQQEIENRRKKRLWIFWSLVLSGATVITAAVLAFLFLLLEW